MQGWHIAQHRRVVLYMMPALVHCVFKTVINDPGAEKLINQSYSNPRLAKGDAIMVGLLQANAQLII